MLTEIITEINKRIETMFTAYGGAKFFGIAETMPVKNTKTSRTQPVIVDSNGNETFVGIDDTAPLIVYHKAINGTATQNAGNAYGSNPFNPGMTFNMSAYVYFDRKQIKALPDQVAASLLAWLATGYNVPLFRSITVSGSSIVLNSAQIVKAEYGLSENPDPANKSFIQLNYSIAAVFAPRCLQTCF